MQGFQAVVSLSIRILSEAENYRHCLKKLIFVLRRRGLTFINYVKTLQSMSDVFDSKGISSKVPVFKKNPVGVLIRIENWFSAYVSELEKKILLGGFNTRVNRNLTETNNRYLLI